MLVKEIMSKHPDALSTEMNIKDAAIEMKKHDFGFLPVKKDGQIIGTLTDRDIVIRGLADGLDPSQTKIADIMSPNIFYCHENDDIEQIADIMCNKQIHRLAVYDEKDNLTGIVSIGDIARKCQDASLSGKLTQAIHAK